MAENSTTATDVLLPMLCKDMIYYYRLDLFKFGAHTNACQL